MVDNELIELSDEQVESLTKLSGKVFKDFLKIGIGGEDSDVDEADLIAIFMKRELETIDIYVDDVYDALELNSIAKLLAATMELNNLEELFRALNRLNRGFTPTNGMDK